MSAVETDRQIAWLLTHLKQTAPQAQTVHPNRLSELRGSLPRRPTVAAVPDALWAPVAGGALILFTGGLALLAGQPWLFPSLGPTAYLQGESPAHPSARAYNSIVGHLVGLLVGFATVFALAVRNDPAPLTSGELTGGRMLAAAIALAMTMLVANLLHASHPPAAATTLLVALGAVHNREQALYLMLGVLVLSLAGELLRHVRLGDAKHLIQPRARRELVRLPRLRRVASPHA